MVFRMENVRLQLSCLLLQLNLSLVQNLGAYLGSPAASSPSCVVTWSQPWALVTTGLSLTSTFSPVVFTSTGSSWDGCGSRISPTSPTSSSFWGWGRCGLLGSGLDSAVREVVRAATRDGLCRLFVMMRLLFLPTVNKNLDHLPARFNPPRHFLKQIFTTDPEVRLLRVIMYCNVPTVFVLLIGLTIIQTVRCKAAPSSQLGLVSSSAVVVVVVGAVVLTLASCAPFSGQQI